MQSNDNNRLFVDLSPIQSDEEYVIEKDKEGKLLHKKRKRISQTEDIESRTLKLLEKIAENTQIVRKVDTLEEGLKRVRINDILQRIHGLENKIRQILSISNKEELMSFEEWKRLGAYFS